MHKRILRSVLPPALKSWLKSLRPRGGHIRPPGIDPSESFGVLVTERKEWLYATLPLRAADYHYDIFLKTSQKRLARRIGLEVAKDYARNVTLSDALAFVEDANLDRFVIKPNSGFSAIACRSLIRDGGAFLDLRRGRRLSMDRLRRELQEERDVLGPGRGDEWLVEELLMPADGSVAPIEDFKFFCFGGVVELIFQRRPVRGKKYLRYRYDRAWQPVDVGLKDRNDGVVRVPENAERLVAVAESATSQLCYPFMRVDLYDTTRGVVFGEFTPGPGQRYGFNAEWNARFVKRWREAAASIEEGIRSGRIKPLEAESDDGQ